MTMAAVAACATDVERLVAEIRATSAGAPVAVAFSGGLDSSTVAALARDALGPDRVLLITVNMGQYAYRRGNQIVLEMADQLGLQQRCLLGQGMQHRVQRGGPACNRCTREIKLGMVKAAARGRLVLTGSNRSDTWGKMGLKVNNGYYAPLLDLEKPEIRAIADDLGLCIPRLGEHSGREGCKLKHLLSRRGGQRDPAPRSGGVRGSGRSRERQDRRTAAPQHRVGQRPTGAGAGGS
jgi:uncharacterized protein